MTDNRPIRVLLADDDEAVIRAYSASLGDYLRPSAPQATDVVDALDEELFGPEADSKPRADIELCRQGEEAIRLVTEALEAGNPFDVVVLDIRMPPGIDGVHAAQRIRDLAPNVRILFVSGFSDYRRRELEELVPPPDFMDFIQKPVRLSVLADRIITAAYG